MIALFYVLPNLHARNRSVLMNRVFFFSFATRERLQTARFFIWWNSVYRVGFQFIFDTLCLKSSRFACFSFLKCALILQILYVITILLDFRLNKCCFFFVKLDLCFSEATRGNISKCVILLCDFSLSTNVPKHFLGSFPLFWYWKKVTQSRYCVVLSFCGSKAALFAFSGQRPAVKAPYLLFSMFQSLSLSPPDRWIFVFGDCSVFACSL